MREKIGLMGGSFDPVHLGHLIIAQYVKESFALAKVIFIPTGQAPHKTYQTSREDRLHMLNLAIGDNEDFAIDYYEINKNQVAYTIDTLAYLKSIYRSSDLYFIIGLDNLHGLKFWKGIGGYNKYVDIILIERKAKVPKGIEDEIAWYKDQYDLDIHYLKTPLIEISSSNIRERLKEGKTVRYMIRDEVADYIYQRGLYK